MTAQVIDLDQHRRKQQPALAPVVAIRGFLDNVVYQGIDSQQASIVVPITALDELMAATLPTEQEQP